ncbi:hypothetical protein [Actinophytocola xinjiangensis]|nr:hypothetical protein [Actinophytocola xinjiangensis]
MADEPVDTDDLAQAAHLLPEQDDEPSAPRNDSDKPGGDSGKHYEPL